MISSAEADRARWRKERLGSEGLLPVPQSRDIESSHAPSLFQSGRTAVSAFGEGEPLDMMGVVREEGVLPSPSDCLIRGDAEAIPSTQSLKRVEEGRIPVVARGYPGFESVRETVKTSTEEEERKEIDEIIIIMEVLPHANDEEIEKMIATAQITTKQKDILRKCLKERHDAFGEELRPAGRAFFEPHKIHLKVDDPIYTPQHRRSVAEEEIIDKEAFELNRKGVIRRAWTSAYNSPMMVVKKKDGRWRSVIDYRRINSVTVKEPYPIPRVDEAFDALTKAKLMTTFDLTWGYWQTPLAEEDKQKTAFTTRSGRWEYNVLPMGITNAVPAFQRNMEMMLSGLLWKKCIIYIDDIIIFGKTFEEHLQNIIEVLERMRRFNVFAKPSKCQFCQKEVTYLGHRVGNGKLMMDDYNVQKIVKMDMPGTLKEIRLFVCLAVYYCRFIKGFAKIARPLMALQSKEHVTS